MDNLDNADGTQVYWSRHAITEMVQHQSVPAETCGECHESFMSGKITDDVMAWVSQLKRLGSEISVVSFRDYAVT